MTRCFLRFQTNVKFPYARGDHIFKQANLKPQLCCLDKCYYYLTTGKKDMISTSIRHYIFKFLLISQTILSFEWTQMFACVRYSSSLSTTVLFLRGSYIFKLLSTYSFFRRRLYKSLEMSRFSKSKLALINQFVLL